MKYDIITFGSATLDVFLKSLDIKVIKSKEVFTGEGLILPYGVKSEVSDLVICSGGGGTNTAVGFARLGLKTALVARCGWDFAGKIVRQEIKKEKVFDELLVQLEGEKTDYSTILIGPNGNRTILVWRGGTRLERAVIDFKKLNSFWFYIASLEGNLELLADLVNFAKENHIQVALNPGKREMEEKEQLLKIAKDVNVFIVNKEEAARLTSLSLTQGKVFSQMCLLLPKTQVVVTDGPNGVSVCLPPKGRLIMDGFKVKMVDQTGAGDGFGSGFIGGLVKGWDLEKSLKLGVSNGASVVGKIGAKQGLIKEKEVDFWLSKTLTYHWEK
jgi:ribokinase